MKREKTREDLRSKNTEQKNESTNNNGNVHTTHSIAFSGELFSEVIVKNPVLVSTIGLCPVVAICISLKSALLLSVITYLTMILAQVLSAILIKSSPQWVRVGLYALVGTAVVAPSMILLEKVFPNNLIALGIYLPLLAINPLVTRQCERVAVKSSAKAAFINALCCSTGYSAVLLVVGLVRELFGRGTIWDIKVISMPAATALTNPFGGFIVIGFMAALLRVYFKKIDPEYAEQLTVESRTAIKKPKQKKSRLKIKVVEYNPNSEDLREDIKTQSAQELPPVAQAEQQAQKPDQLGKVREETAPLQEEPASLHEDAVAIPEDVKADLKGAKVQEKREKQETRTAKYDVQEQSAPIQEQSAPIQGEVTSLHEGAAEPLKDKKSALKAAKEQDKRAPHRAKQDVREDTEPTLEESVGLKEKEPVQGKSTVPLEKPAPLQEEPLKAKKPAKRKKIEYTSQEIEELLAKSLDDLINDSFDTKDSKPGTKNIGEVHEE